LLFPDGNPIDKQLRPAAAGGDTWFTVIGVVEDVLLDDFRRESPDPMVYLPGVSLSPAVFLLVPRALQIEGTDQIGPAGS
jgi:hypothetical protein